MQSQRSLWWRGIVAALSFLLVGAIWVFAVADAAAQTEGEEGVRQGEELFRRICASCHTIGRGVLVGPDLQGVTERRVDSWLKVHIQSPTIHHEQNDPISVANREKFGLRMPNLGLTDQQVEAVITYLQTTEIAPVARPALYIPTLAIGVLAIVVFTLIGLIAGTKRVEVRA